MPSENPRKTAPQSKRFACVIEGFDKSRGRNITQAQIASMCQAFSVLHSMDYWLITHDKDVDKETGEFKRVHHHLVCQFPSRHTKTAVIKMISVQLDVPKDCVSVRLSESLNHDIRYLTHMDYLEEGKTSYSPSDVITNDEVTLEKALQDSADRLTTAFVFEVCKTARNTEDIIKRLGVNTYLKYRLVIRDLRLHYFHGTTI